LILKPPSLREGHHCGGFGVSSLTTSQIISPWKARPDLQGLSVWYVGRRIGHSAPGWVVQLLLDVRTKRGSCITPKSPGGTAGLEEYQNSSFFTQSVESLSAIGPASFELAAGKG